MGRPQNQILTKYAKARKVHDLFPKSDLLLTSITHTANPWRSRMDGIPSYVAQITPYRCTLHFHLIYFNVFLLVSLIVFNNDLYS